MSENNSGSVAIEALVIVCRAISQLEVKNLAVASFGKEGNIQLLHDFDQPFTGKAGVRLHMINVFSNLLMADMHYYKHLCWLRANIAMDFLSKMMVKEFDAILTEEENDGRQEVRICGFWVLAWASCVRSVTFHPDRRTLFCGLDSSLKVYSWEPVIFHDALDMGWSTLDDLYIDDGKLLGCSYYQNLVSVWVENTTLIEPHGRIILPKENTRVQTKFNRQQDLTERVESPKTSDMSSDDDANDIKNIYVDKTRPMLTILKVSVSFKPSQRRESIVNKQDTIAVSLKPSHRRRLSTTKLDIECLLASGLKSGSNTPTIANFQKRVLADDAAKDDSNEKAPISAVVTKEF
ncbi:hypothetical protein Tco_0730815 [Tanacetum coccineum]